VKRRLGSRTLAIIAFRASGRSCTTAVTLPTYAGPNGMPIGVQLVGSLYDDDRLLAVAHRALALLGRGPEIEL
jgi:Asp-tRNA(Asn)/Glu-tRNA(Gln) amidotransferase A subunit family amidase